MGHIYFVKDGNHRVSVARYRGVAYIDAEVLEFITAPYTSALGSPQREGVLPLPLTRLPRRRTLFTIGRRATLFLDGLHEAATMHLWTRHATNPEPV